MSLVRRRTSATLRLFALVLLSCSLGACRSSDPAQEGSAPTDEQPSAESAGSVEGRLVVLSSRDEKFMLPLWDLVREQHPKLELVVDYGKDSAYLDRVRSGGDSLGADLFLSKGSAAMEAAASEELLAELPTELLDRVNPRFRGSGGRWLGLSARARIIVARRSMEASPGSVLELADPRFEGRVARTVAANSSFVGGVAALLASSGEENTRAFLSGLDRNSSNGNVYPKHTPTVAAAMEGSADLALVNHYYFYRAVLGASYDPELTQEKAEELISAAPIEAIYPDAGKSGVAWNVTGGGILSNSPNPEAARAVLAILLSDAGQQAYAWTNREYPVVEGVPAAPGVQPPDSFSWSDASLVELAAQNGAAIALIQELGLE